MNILNRKSAIVSALLVSLLSLTLLNFKNAAPENDYKPDAYVHDVLRDLGAVLPSYYRKRFHRKRLKREESWCFRVEQPILKAENRNISVYTTCAPIATIP